jgi:PAS domain S-box-containing protein
VNSEKERVLIVDDDENILFLLSKTLERAGYQVETAEDGLQGLLALQASSPFAVLLTDLMMPNMSGMDLLSRARQMDPYIEIIVITAAGSIETAIAAMRDGHAWDYLLKPLESIQQLTVIVGRAIAHRKLVMERAALQAQIQAEAERLKTLVNSVGEAILAASSKGIITVANPSAARLLGREDLVGGAVTEVLPPRLVTTVENWKVIGNRFPATLEMQWNDGTSLMVSLTPLVESERDQSGWVMALRDISTIKQQEKLKTLAMSEVIGKIRLLLAEAMNALVDLNLRVPQDERTASSIFRLTTVWERIQSWGDELLTVAQVDSGRSPRPAIVDPEKLLRAMPEDNSVKRYQQGGGRLTLRLADPLPAVQIDPEMVSQLVNILARRAILRSPSNSEVRVSASVLDDQMWIEISDNGPRADDTNPLQTFDQSLLRLSADANSPPGNLGLELMRARSILNRLDGQLWIGGQGPRGSTIIVCLPARVPALGPNG